MLRTGKKKLEGKLHMEHSCKQIYISCKLTFSTCRVIYGLTENTQRGHILRATLEAVCFQVRDILEAMSKDCQFHLVKLNVDGGMTANKLFLQSQADLVGLEVIRPEMAESTALVYFLHSNGN